MHIFTKKKNNAAGSSPATPGKLNLRIMGFAAQHIVTVDQIVRAIDLLPAYHLEELREIVYAPHSTPSNPLDQYLLPAWRRTKGEFRQKERRIIFFDFDSADLFHQILYHEIGHFVFFLRLNSRMKKRWVTEIFPHSSCITAYAASNASEDFAETYACYMRDPEGLKQALPEKYVYMRDCVFSGRAETLKERN